MFTVRITIISPDGVEVMTSQFSNEDAFYRYLTVLLEEFPCGTAVETELVDNTNREAA